MSVAHFGSSLAQQFVPTHPTRCCGAQGTASLGPGRVLSPCQAWPPGVWHAVSQAPVVGSALLWACTGPPRCWVTGRVRQYDAPSLCWHRASPSAPPAACVVSSTPLAGWCSWAVPRGSYPVGVPPGGVPVPYGCGCQACEVHTLAGSPLGRAWRFPRVAQRCNELLAAPTTSWDLAGFCGLPVGYSGSLLRVIPESGLPGWCLAPACAVWEKKNMCIYWLNLQRMTTG